MKNKLPRETAKFTLSDADILAMIAHTQAIVSGYYISYNRRRLLSAFMWVPVFFIIFQITLLYRSNPELGFRLIYISTAILVFFITLVVKKYLNSRAEIRSYIDGDGWYKLEQTITTSDKSILLKNEFGVYDYSWYSFASFIEDDNRALIGAGVGPCIVIPKNVGISNDRIDWIRNRMIERSLEI